MAKQSISQILKTCAQYKKKEERVIALRQEANDACKVILRHIYDPNIKFLLPEGDPPYKPSQFNEPGVLYADLRKLYLFVEGGNPNLKQVRRESLFIDLLESVDPEDAKLLLSMKDKKSPYKGLSEDIVRAAFPELIPT